MKLGVNKKIRNATQSISGGITFKSKLEKSIYDTLLEQGFNPKYEPITFVIWEGFRPTIPYYDRETNYQRDVRLAASGGSSAKMLVRKKARILNVQYTPDFYFKYNDLNVYIEAKGIENDVFYLKKKMFIKYLDDLYLEKGEKSIYFEVYNRKQLLQAIEIIKNYEQE
nr:MAG: Protein of unknown function (DUF1064) [Bacteriophage sp.]